MIKQRLLRSAAVLGPGLIAFTFESVRHPYLDEWLIPAKGNIATGLLVLGTSSLLLSHIFKRLDEWELDVRRAEAHQSAMHERQRIAADLHDYVGQSLFYLNVQLNDLARYVEANGEPASTIESGAEPPRPPLDDMRHIVGTLSEHIRQTIFELSFHDDDREAPFTVRVKNRLKQFQKETGLETNLRRLSHRCRPDCPGAEGHLLAILQESLNNVRRHARAATVYVDVHSDDDRDVLSVRDDGRGFDPVTVNAQTAHFGLAFMRKRVEKLGGRLLIESAPGRGTTVRFERAATSIRPSHRGIAAGHPQSPARNRWG